MIREIRKQNVVINKVRRIPVVIYLRKILPILIFLFVILISFLIGLWNIKKFEYTGEELINITEEEIFSYLAKYEGKNIFLLKPLDIENTLIESDGYIKDVNIKKVLPNRIQIKISEFSPLYLGYSSDNCLLFADTGELISEICSECEQECPTSASLDNLVYISSDSLLESGGKLIYFEEVYMVEKVLTEFKYQVLTLEIKDGIATFKDIQEHLFIFDLSSELDVQLARMYLVGEKIDKDVIKFSSLDLRFTRPVMKF